MDLNQFFSLNTIVLCLGIFALTFLARRVIETTWKGAVKNRYWREIFLPTSGIITGILLGWIATMFPWPQGLDSASGRILYGATAGLLSSFIYNRVKAWLKSKNVSG